MVQGTTVEITRVFTDFDGVAYDPTEIELKLFDLQKQQINETISVTAAYKCDVGGSTRCPWCCQRVTNTA